MRENLIYVKFENFCRKMQKALMMFWEEKKVIFSNRGSRENFPLVISVATNEFFFKFTNQPIHRITTIENLISITTQHHHRAPLTRFQIQIET